MFPFQKGNHAPDRSRATWTGQTVCSLHLHHGAFDDDAGGDIFPQRHQQLVRQRHDRRLLQTAAIAVDPFFEPDVPPFRRSLVESLKIEINRLGGDLSV
jgi:hypothetical protein